MNDRMLMKIMIVDDNKGMRELIGSVSCGEHDSALECSGGIEAVTSFNQFHPDVVLMDIEMKDMDGFAAAEKIHADDPAAKIIFVTNHNTPAFRAKAEALHASGFVAKENLSDLIPLIYH
jgi:two-component system, chemotaxis family, chemotaxis protein CheY